MGLFEQEKKAEKKPEKVEEELLPVRVRRALVKAAHEWIEAHLSARPNGLVDYVNSYLTRRVDKMIAAAVGIDDSFGRSEVRWDSPISKQVQAAALVRAEAIIDKYLEVEEKNIAQKLPDDLRKAVDKRYEEAFKESLLELARERGEERAAVEFENILAPKRKKGK